MTPMIQPGSDRVVEVVDTAAIRRFGDGVVEWTDET